MTEATATRLHAAAVAYERTPVGDALLAGLGRGEGPAGFPLLDLDAPPTPADSPWLDRPALADALTRMNAAWGNTLSEATVAAIRGEGRLIITGQQPGLLLGPAYTLYKAITAMALAERLADRSPVPLVPAFWIASEDHDIEEVNRCTIGSKPFTCDHDELEGGGPRPPVGSLSPARWREPIIAYVDAALPAGPAKDAVLEIVRRLDFGSYTTAFARLLAALVGEGRLVLIDPMQMRELTAPALADVVERRDAVAAAFDRGTEQVRGAGYDPQLERLGLFRIADGRRVACEMTDDLPGLIRANPAGYSPGAALRPLVQDMALPVLATVGGPGELRYLWQIDPLYEAAGVRRSRLWPRMSVTVLGPRDAERARAFGLDGERVFEAAALAEAFDPARFDVEDADLREIEALRDQLLARVRSLDGEVDAKLVGKAGDSIDHQVAKLADRVRNDRLSRRGLGKGELKQLAHAVTPHGRPAERVVSPLDYVGRFGVGFVTQLMQSVDPTAIRHHLVQVHSS